MSETRILVKKYRDVRSAQTLGKYNMDLEVELILACRLEMLSD